METDNGVPDCNDQCPENDEVWVSSSVCGCISDQNADGVINKPIVLSPQTLDVRIYLLVTLNPQPTKMMAPVYTQRIVVNATTL